MEVELSTLYDINKQGYGKQPPLNKQQIKDAKLELYNYAISNGKYFMLLCKEQSDYTILHLGENASYNTFSEEVIGCLEDRGQIIAIEKQDNGAYECWIKRSGLAYMYALFPYDAAVIEC